MRGKGKPALALRRGLDRETRIAVREYRGEKFVDFREWWQPAGAPDFVPTKRGITVPLESLDQVIEALQGIKEDLEGAGE